MKKIYEKPDFGFEKFEVEDKITISIGLLDLEDGMNWTDLS